MAERLAQRFSICSGVLAIVALCAAPGLAEQPQPLDRPTQNLFGMTGLIDMPSAEMQPDGQFSVTASYFGGFLRNTASAQILPGVEAAFRYSVLEDFFAGQGQSSLFDRSFDVKVRVMNETVRSPALVIGLQDFLGTGVYSGEYVAATKSFDLGELGRAKVTGGIGWGRFAGTNGVSNPLGVLSDRLESRADDFGSGGSVNLGQYFQGSDVGLFAGVAWDTPIQDLTAKVEYSDDDYAREQVSSAFRPKGQVNVGLEYRPVEGIEIGAYYMYGSEFGVRLSISGNPFRPVHEADYEPAPRPVTPRPRDGRVASLGVVFEAIDAVPATAPLGDRRVKSAVVHERLGSVRWADVEMHANADVERCPVDLARATDAEFGVVDVVTFTREGGEAICTVALRLAGQHAVRLTSRVHAQYPVDWFDQPEQRQQLVEILAEELAGDSIGLIGIEIAPRRVEVYIDNKRFRSTPRAIGRTARALTRTMPASVEVFEITPVSRSLPVASVILQRSALEDQVNRPDAGQRSWATAKVQNAAPVAWGELLKAKRGQYPKFSWQFSTSTPTNLFDPDQPVRFDLALIAGGSIEVMPGLSLNAAVSQRVVGDLDDIQRDGGSLVDEKVRSEIAKYLREDKPVIRQLTMDYVSKLAPGMFGRVSAGLLERMYAGISTEVLWKPATENWGIGFEANFVRQRDFTQRFDLRNYETLTGHVSLYWQTDFYDIGLQVDAGRYLAGDWGTTVSAKRRFANGWELGGFFTLTDMPFSEFGEGSFDKGLFLTIPLNWGLPYESRSEFATILKPLTRDGGQRLEVSNRLYPTVEDFGQQGLSRQWGGFWE